MNTEPAISIITITFNAEAVIAPTLRSIAEQTCRDFEHIVIDGASSDSTLSLCRSLSARDRAPRILSEPDNGLYDAMNKGLRLARGRYVIFLNAGDAFHSPRTLELYHRATAGNPAVIYGDTIIVDSDRNFVSPRHLSAPEILSLQSFAAGMLVCHQAFMARRDLAPLYDTGFRFSADYDWCLRILARTEPRDCVNLNAITIDYLSDGLTDKNRFPSLRERYRIMSRQFGAVPTFFRHVGFLFRAAARKLKS